MMHLHFLTLFLTYIVCLLYLLGALSSVFLSLTPFIWIPPQSFLRMDLTRGNYSNVYPFDEIPATVIGFKKFSCSSAVIFSYFFLFSMLVRWCLLLVFSRNFSSLQAFWYFPDLAAVFLLFFFSSSNIYSDPWSIEPWKMYPGTFFMAQFHSYNPDVYSYCL